MSSHWSRALAAALLVLSSCLFATARLSAEEPARGHLLVIGGGHRDKPLMEFFACLAAGAKGKVLAFPQASERPEAGAEIEAELKALGIGEVVVVGVDRAGADGEAVLKLAEGATGVYFGGGDQARLMAVLRGSRLEQKLWQLYRGGAVMAGTSAGAAVMSRVMITGDEKRPLNKDENWQTIEADNVVTEEGLGFLPEAVVDQHFVRRRRHNRIISLTVERAPHLGLAIDESTAAWVKPDRTFEVVGEGPVLVFDATSATRGRDATGHGLRAADMKLHVLRPGAQFDLRERRVLRLDSPTPAGPVPASCAP